MKKNKKKVIIIIISLLAIIITVITCIYLFKDHNLNNQNIQENKPNNENLENIEYTYTEYGPGFVCSNQVLYSKTDFYDKGEFVYCEIGYEMPAISSGINEIWFETTHDDDIEYIEITDIFEDWKLISNDGIIHLTTDKPSTYGDGAYKVKFRINSSTKKEILQIAFKNIKYKDAENKYYKTDDSIIELSIRESTNYKYEESKNNDSISFYKFSENKGYELINKYECESDTCHIYAAQCFAYLDLENGMTFIYDNNKSIMYDFNKGVIGKYDTSLYSLYDDNNQPYFVVKDLSTKKSGIIDPKGNIIKKISSEEYGINQWCELNRQSYSIKNDLIVEKKDNKYGIVKITKNEVVLDYQYDDIRLYNDKYYKAKTGDSWYLYSFDTKDKVHEQGYKELFIATDEIIITQIDKSLYIKDYAGNNIIEDKIETYMDYNEYACCGATPGINIQYNQENNKIKIYVSKAVDDEYMYEIYTYEYDIQNKKLTEVNE